MESKPENFSAEESLLLISQMIREAQGKVQKNAFYFLLWGWVVVTAYAGVFILTRMDYPYPYIVWAITIPAWVVSMIKGIRTANNTSTPTHLDRISKWLWISFSLILVTVIAFGWKLNWQVTPLILAIGALPTFISGIIIRFKPLMIGGIVFWLAGIACFLVDLETQPIIGAVAVVFGYLIPGYQLKNRME